MSDVSAIVLSLGEETTQRAIESVKRQSLSVEDIIIIENVSPFHKAFNCAASKVKTDFFIQVDADMVLDVNCINDLRHGMAPGIGVVVGHLSDDLLGRTVGIKLFRTACFQEAQFADSISPDTDFIDDMNQSGWSIVYALKFSDENIEKCHIFGEHRPVYTSQYTFEKHLLEGRRYRYRNDFDGLAWHLNELLKSDHEAALIAQIAMGHGVFEEMDQDRLVPFRNSPDCSRTKNFLKNDHDHVEKLAKYQRLKTGNLRKVFKKYYRLGIDLYTAGAVSQLVDCLDFLNSKSRKIGAIAKLGVIHGLFSDRFERKKFNCEFDKIKGFVPIDE